MCQMNDIHAGILPPIAELQADIGDGIALGLGPLYGLLNRNRRTEFPMLYTVHIGEVGGDEVTGCSGVDETASFDVVDENIHDEWFF